MVVSVGETAPLADGGIALQVTATLQPKDDFVLRAAWLFLELATTHYSRTVLDGYREHTTGEVWQSVALFRDRPAVPDVALARTVILTIPFVPAAPTRFAKRWWRARASIEPRRRRGLSSVVSLEKVTEHITPPGGAPVVDGTGFLPLYEFRG